MAASSAPVPGQLNLWHLESNCGIQVPPQYIPNVNIAGPRRGWHLADNRSTSQAAQRLGDSPDSVCNPFVLPNPQDHPARLAQP